MNQNIFTTRGLSNSSDLGLAIKDSNNIFLGSSNPDAGCIRTEGTNAVILGSSSGCSGARPYQSTILGAKTYQSTILGGTSFPGYFCTCCPSGWHLHTSPYEPYEPYQPYEPIDYTPYPKVDEPWYGSLVDIWDNLNFLYIHKPAYQKAMDKLKSLLSPPQSGQSDSIRLNPT